VGCWGFHTSVRETGGCLVLLPIGFHLHPLVWTDMSLLHQVCLNCLSLHVSAKIWCRHLSIIIVHICELFGNARLAGYVGVRLIVISKSRVQQQNIEADVFKGTIFQNMPFAGLYPLSSIQPGEMRSHVKVPGCWDLEELLASLFTFMDRVLEKCTNKN